MSFGYSKNDLATEIAETGWSEKIETGNDALDEQHREYFSFVNDYLAAAGKPTTNNDKHLELVKKLNFLRHYAMDHFATEQQLMKDAGDPDFKQHLAEHDTYLRHIKALCKQLANKGYSDKLAREVYYYALEWFITHIQTTDMKCVEFLKKHDSQAEKLAQPLAQFG